MSKGRSMHKSRRPVAVGAALDDVIRRLGIGRKLAEYDVVTSWESLVGEQIARVAKPERVENGILFVTVATAPWRAELIMRRLDILKTVNAKAGRKVLKDIRFR